MEDRAFWLAIRRCILLLLDAIEVRWGFPRTAERPQPHSTKGHVADHSN